MNIDSDHPFGTMAKIVIAEIIYIHELSATILADWLLMSVVADVSMSFLVVAGSVVIRSGGPGVVTSRVVGWLVIQSKLYNEFTH